MLRAPTSTVNGLLDLAEDLLCQYQGVKHFSKYSVIQGTTLRRTMRIRFPRVAEHDDEDKMVDNAEVEKGKL